MPDGVDNRESDELRIPAAISLAAAWAAVAVWVTAATVRWADRMPIVMPPIARRTISFP